MIGLTDTATKQEFQRPPRLNRQSLSILIEWRELMARESKYNQKLIDRVFKMIDDLSLTTKEIAKANKITYNQCNYILYNREPSYDLVEVIREEIAEATKPKTILESFLEFFTLSSKK
jgi:hypothetical protein